MGVIAVFYAILSSKVPLHITHFIFSHHLRSRFGIIDYNNIVHHVLQLFDNIFNFGENVIGIINFIAELAYFCRYIFDDDDTVIKISYICFSAFF